MILSNWIAAENYQVMNEFTDECVKKMLSTLFTVLDKYFSRLNFKNVKTTKNIDFLNLFSFFSVINL